MGPGKPSGHEPAHAIVMAEDRFLGVRLLQPALDLRATQVVGDRSAQMVVDDPVDLPGRKLADVGQVLPVGQPPGERGHDASQRPEQQLHDRDNHGPGK